MKVPRLVSPHLQGWSRVFQELPAPPVADLVPQQPADLVAYGRNDEHGGDVQLALAGEDRRASDHGCPDDRDTHVADRSGGKDD